LLYLLQIHPPLANRTRYYLGTCADGRLHTRFREHRHGMGAALTRAAVRQGYQLELVGIAPGGRKEEARYKSWKDHRKVLKEWRKQTMKHIEELQETITLLESLRQQIEALDARLAGLLHSAQYQADLERENIRLREMQQQVEQ